MLILAAILTVALMAWRALSHGPEMAIQAGWALAIISPTWIIQELGPLNIDIRFLVFVLTCLVGLFRPSQIIRFDSWMWLDIALLTVIVISNVSKWQAGVWTFGGLLESLQVWLFPYLIGRVIAASTRTNHDFVRVGARVGVIVATYCLFESISHSNFLNDLVGRFGSLQGETDYRFGLKRAEATFRHPIYCGMAVTLLSPFVFTQANRAFCNECQKIWIWSPLISFLGVLGTLSRGPIAVFMIVMFVAVAFTFRAARIPILSLAIISVFALFPLQTSVFTAIEGFTATDGFEIRERQLFIDIFGERHEYTGTRHRYLQFLVYSKAIDEAGWLGFGAWGSSPSHQLYVEEKNRGLFRSIDSQFLLQLLNTGWLGIVSFLLLISTTVYYGLRVATAESNANRLLALTLAGVLFAVAISLNTVWFANDFSFLWLCNSGIVCSLWARRQASRGLPLNAAISALKSSHHNHGIPIGIAGLYTAKVHCSDELNEC